MPEIVPSPEEIQIRISDKVREVQDMFGEQAAFFYQAGFMDAVELISDLSSELHKTKNTVVLNKAFSGKDNPIAKAVN